MNAGWFWVNKNHVLSVFVKVVTVIRLRMSSKLLMNVLLVTACSLKLNLPPFRQVIGNHDTKSISLDPKQMLILTSDAHTNF